MTTMESPKSMFEETELIKSPHCPGNHKCHFCGATEDEKLIVKNTHMKSEHDLVDECEDCFCPGCHFNTGCTITPDHALARRAAAEMGDCPTG